MSLQALPTEILICIADLLHTPSSSSSTTAGPLTTPSPSLHLLRTCASLNRLFRSIFRPLLWSRTSILSEDDPDSPSAAAQRTPLAFSRALEALHGVLVTSPEVGGFIRELAVFLPSGYGGGASDTGGDIGGGTTSNAAYSNKNDHSGSNTRGVFPLIARNLTHLRTLRVISCPTKGIGGGGGFRVDWDVLSDGLREGFERIFALESLSVVQMLGVVAPPRMLFGGGGGTVNGGRTLRGMRVLILVAHCPISPKRIEQIDSTRSALNTSDSGLSLLEDQEDGSGMDASDFVTEDDSDYHAPSGASSRAISTFPRSSSSHHNAILTVPEPNNHNHRTNKLHSLHLAFCDTSLLRYITTLYPHTFALLTTLSLNVIERDLPLCQFILDHASPAGILQSFDCTIRCNTELYYGEEGLHALDFEKRPHVGLRRLVLRYLLLSRVTEAVGRAIEVNIATALECARVEGGRLGSEGGEKDVHTKQYANGGLESIHLAVDWTLSGDELLLGTFKNVDQIVAAKFRSSSSTSSSSPSARTTPPPLTRYDSASEHARRRPPPPSLKTFTLEATHWPCLPRCSFRTKVTRGGGGARMENEGKLDQFCPFLSQPGGVVDFKSRYVLESRRGAPCSS